MRQKKWAVIIIVSVLMTMISGMTAFGAVWRLGQEPNGGRWWYDNEDGTYARDGWYWLDGNRDGVAECYYFDGDGWMAADTVTPDGYRVNGDGAWVSGGVVMTRNGEQASGTEKGEGNQLVVYFSRTGTTERAAKRISEMTGALLVRLEAAEPYSGSYQETLTRAQRELNSNARPAVTTVVENMDRYEVIYVGYPIWHGTVPRLVLTFLESYDLEGKTIIPFCTSGGSGIEASIRDIRGSVGGAGVTGGRRVNDVNVIEGWLSGLGLNP